MSKITRHSFWIGAFFLLLFALISYAPKIQSFGYYKDDKNDPLFICFGNFDYLENFLLQKHKVYN